MRRDRDPRGVAGLAALAIAGWIFAAAAGLLLLRAWAGFTP
jgi:hypothetical protein